MARRTQVESRGTFTWEVPAFDVRVVEGPERGATVRSDHGSLSVGSQPGNDLRLTDPTVSGCHVSLDALPAGIRIRDLGSTNGTFVGELRVADGLHVPPFELCVGRTRIAVDAIGPPETHAAPARSQLYELFGASPGMQTLYNVIERAAPTDAPVLILGESGTGKELVARAIHASSRRSAARFEVVDCGGLPPTLVESELFGHERGAFTGAHAEHVGAFERAHGGTLFLDELGELPLEVQPKLLRVLAEGEVRRVGGRTAKKVDVRVVAATNRDLRADVNQGRFRADLYFRLRVVPVSVPPLRERLEDLERIVPALLDRIEAERGLTLPRKPDRALYESLRQHHWPGNVRELRNYLEQYVILRNPPSFDGDPEDGSASAEPSAGALTQGLLKLPLREAKALLLDRFEKAYLAHVLERAGGSVVEAARQAGVDRKTLFRVRQRRGPGGGATE